MVKRVLSGIDRTDLMDKALKGKRLAVATGGAAVSRELRHVADVLCERYTVCKLFNMIYGIRGEFRYGETTPVYTDSATGLQVYSIFNRDRIAPPAEML